MNKKRLFITNILYAFSAQGISLVLSFLMSLIVPKMLGITEYSYWQLFIFYISYVGIFHFGLNDGVYLKNGGISYEKLDKESLGSQFKISFMIQCVIAVIIIVASIFLSNNADRTIVYMSTAIYMIFFNLSWYLGYLFQASNETKWYSVSVAIEKIVYMAAIIILLVLGIKQFEVYVILYLVSKAVSFIYCIIRGKAVVFSKMMPMKYAVKDWSASVKVGINLTIASLVSMFILGSGRMVIDKVWGIEEFGKLSFALSLSSFVLMFISQVSMVLFPTLRTLDKNAQNKIYGYLRSLLTIVLPITFILYFPLKVVLLKWLPEYEVSITYLALMLPLCTYDGKMNLLCNTYLKVLRKEKVLLKINIITVLLSSALSILGAYAIQSIYAVVLGMVFSIAVRSILAEQYLAFYMKKNIRINLVSEFAISIIFMGVAWNLENVLALIIMLGVYMLYIVVNHKEIQTLWNAIKTKGTF